MPKKPVVPPARSRAKPQQDFAAQLQSRKQESTLQLLFKAARLLDEAALARVQKGRSGPKLRRSHSALFPHIDLEGTRVTELAERLGVSKQAVSQLVDDLEQMGVVARSVDPDDARARRVAFTERGRAGLLEGLSVLRALEDELADAVGTQPMQHLREALLGILAVVPDA